MTLAADSKEGIMMNMNNTRIDECMDLLDEEFLTEIEMEELALTEQEQNNIQQNVLKEVRSKRKRWSKRSIAILVAAAIGVSTLTVAVAAGFDIGPAFQKFFGVSEESEIALLNAAGGQVVASDTKGGYTVDVKGVVGDKKSVNILFELTAPEGETVSDMYRFTDSRIWLDKVHSMGWHVTQIDDGAPNDNKGSYVISCTTDENFSGEKVSLILGNLVDDSVPSGNLDEPSKILEAGEWNLDFTMDYRDTSKTYKVNREFSFNGETVTLKSMSLSPLSASFELQSKLDLENLEMNAKGNLLSDESGEYAVSIQMKDGSVFREFSGGGTGSKGLKSVVTIQFAKLIDPADIASVTYQGLTIPAAE